MKQRIRQCFGKAASSYSKAASVQRVVARNCASLCPKEDFRTVLDIGSGVGFLHNELRERISYSNYISLDLVRPMLWEQRDSGASLVAADGEELPFAAESFDLLVSSSAMQWYGAPELTIPRSFEVLKSGGRFAIAIFTHGTLAELADVSARTGFGSVKELKPSSFYMELFDNMSGLKVDYASEEHVEFFPSVKHFLKQHKMTGAVASSEKISWGREKYRRFVEEYENLYRGESGIKASYKVFLAYGRKL
ncbi:methyltransferase domain-containing protein [Maridesulfovibrio salexigens]|uniref:Methyltransferase type 11 n=1 Tax=Maridesulfovibrio salexigens (strain ATCC 14822 / DSM 2638 / NCIMB 8403 / VKM B-1763) TaxID=526222 RepID=C6BRS1_MARSD|nr:methyltransferase domain-containing protein [Maridesulfovibrio salexigens]ACS79511.1 Methyltransferase type 11 [Maridesulfovibrio salexigens DSM 2638]